MSDDALREVLRSPLDDPPSRRRRRERRTPDGTGTGTAVAEDALSEILRSPLDDPPPDHRGSWAVLAALVVAAGCGFGVTAGVRALLPGDTVDTTVTTAEPAATSTTLAGPTALGEVEAQVLAAFRQGGHLYLVVATTVLPGEEPTEVAGVASAHWVLRLGDGDLVVAAAEYLFPAAPGAFTLEFPDTDISGGAQLLAYPAAAVVERTYTTTRDSAQFPWSGPLDGEGGVLGAPYHLGGEEIAIHEIRLDDGGGEIGWHLSWDSEARAVVTAAATYTDPDAGPQAIVSERDLPTASLVAAVGADLATRSGGVHLFHLDDALNPTYRSRFWGDPERAVVVEQLELAITVRLFTYAAEPVVIPVGLTVTGEYSPPTATTSTSTSTTLGTQDGVEALAVFVDALMDGGDLSGVVLVADEAEVLYEAAAGWADRETETLISPDTRFNLGSMNKMFTAVAILQLVEQGALRLDGTISAYLPDYPNSEVAEQVTIDQLLTHTSGLGNVFTEEFGADPHRYRSNADYLPLFADQPLLFPPGEQFTYSNAGYVVLGLVIESLSGQSYDDYVRTHIFEPAGMTATSAFDIDEEVPDLALGYTTQDAAGEETGVLRPNADLMPGRGFAAGGGYSTAGDLLRFRQALYEGRLLSPASVDLLTTGRVEVGPAASYAYGFFDRVQGGRRVVGHGGGAPGVCSSLSMYPETGHTVVILSNSDADCLTVLDYLKEHPPA